jgi:CheY-like chemotaxis protein
MIAIVEDNPHDARITKRILTNAGYEVVIANDGQSALELVNGTPLDLILMDINLPDMSGVEVVQSIKKSDHRYMPIIALTANTMHGDREILLQAGCDDYIAKPITRSILLNTISRYLD